MAMDREKFEELCAAYALGALEGEELREFESALRTADDDMKRLLFEFQRVALHLPVVAQEATPSPRIKQRILERIHSDTVPQPQSMFSKLVSLLGFDNPRIGFAISFALIIVTMGIGYYAFLLRNAIHERDQRIAVIQQELSQQQQHFTVLQTELIRKEELLKVLQSPRIEVVIMNGKEINPSGYGKIIWDPIKKSAILQISNLPAVPKDKDYQLWVIKDQKPISAGVFTVNDPLTETLFKIEQLVETDKKSINAFAITLEPKGGVPQPTGQMYLLGTPTL